MRPGRAQGKCPRFAPGLSLRSPRLGLWASPGVPRRVRRRVSGPNASRQYEKLAIGHPGAEKSPAKARFLSAEDKGATRLRVRERWSLELFQMFSFYGKSAIFFPFFGIFCDFFGFFHVFLDFLPDFAAIMRKKRFTTENTEVTEKRKNLVRRSRIPAASRARKKDNCATESSGRTQAAPSALYKGASVHVCAHGSVRNER